MKVTVFLIFCFLLVNHCSARTITVAQDGSGDFTTIQDAIDHAWDGDMVEVRPGIYSENINFYGKAITVMSIDPNDLATVQATVIRNTSYPFGTTRFESYEDSNSVLTGFTIQSTDTAGQEQGIGVYCYYSSPLIKNNIIENHIKGVFGESATPTLVGNHIRSNVEYGVYDCDGCIKMCTVSLNGGDGLKSCDGEIKTCSIYANGQNGITTCNALINNCVIRNNTFDGLNDVSGDVINCTIVSNNENGLRKCSGTIKNCIVTSNGHYGLSNCTGSIKYNNIWSNGYGSYGEGTVPGTFDTHNNPLFVNVSDHDYHLQSEVGHWDDDSNKWISDSLTSPCIDAGDPYDPTGEEPYPNGDIINQGAYGGTEQASKSPNGQTVYCDPKIPGDVSGDCRIDLIDYSIMAEDWLKNNIENQEVFFATEIWSAFYDGLGHGQDEATAIAVDSLGNVYVTGYSDTKSFGNDNGFTTIKYNPNGSRCWVALYQMQNVYDTPTDIAVDSSGNVYITGSYYYTIKYDPNGNQLWVAHYDQGRQATAIAIDDIGNVYVTGWSISGDYATIKYSPSGEEQWVRRYDSGGDDSAFVLKVDSLGNVYVAGRSNNDYVTVKYDSSGNERWAVRYSGSWSDNTTVDDLFVDELGNVYITGNRGTIKYDFAGNEIWVRPYTPTGRGAALAVDDVGNVYVTGGYGNYVSRKYDSNGNTLWVATYDGGNVDYATDIALDGSGVYVTGWSSGSGYVTVKYDPNGNEIWVVSSDAYSGDYSPSMALDNSGNIYVTGRKECGGPAGGQNFATFKYQQHADMVDVCTQPIDGDTNDDCKVDFWDIRTLTENWLECNLDPPEACWE